MSAAAASSSATRNVRQDAIPWEEYFMTLAITASMRSKDNSTQVGCCLVDPTTFQVIGLGYNGLPRGIDDTEEIWKHKSQYVVHDAANVFAHNRSANFTGSQFFCTLFPCWKCALLIIQARVSEVIYISFRNKTFEMVDSERVNSFQHAYTLLKKAKVAIRRYKVFDPYENVSGHPDVSPRMATVLNALRYKELIEADKDTDGIPLTVGHEDRKGYTEKYNPENTPYLPPPYPGQNHYPPDTNATSTTASPWKVAPPQQARKIAGSKRSRGVTDEGENQAAQKPKKNE